MLRCIRYASGAFRITGSILDRDRFKPLCDILNKLRPGDILEFDRGTYSHYALYLGDGKVMNIRSENKNKTTAQIKVQCIFEVCRDSKVCIRNHDDVAEKEFRVHAKDPHKILTHAKSFDRIWVPYEYVFRNCEYYCTLWRFGVGFSTQVATPRYSTTGGIVRGLLEFNWVTSLVSYGYEWGHEVGVYDRYREFYLTGK